MVSQWRMKLILLLARFCLDTWTVRACSRCVCVQYRKRVKKFREGEARPFKQWGCLSVSRNRQTISNKVGIVKRGKGENGDTFRPTCRPIWRLRQQNFKHIQLKQQKPSKLRNPPSGARNILWIHLSLSQSVSHSLCLVRSSFRYSLILLSPTLFFGLLDFKERERERKTFSFSFWQTNKNKNLNKFNLIPYKSENNV